MCSNTQTAITSTSNHDCSHHGRLTCRSDTSVIHFCDWGLVWPFGRVTLLLYFASALLLWAYNLSCNLKCHCVIWDCVFCAYGMSCMACGCVHVWCVCLFVIQQLSRPIICLLVLGGGFKPLTFEDNAASLPVNPARSCLVFTYLSSFFFGRDGTIGCEEAPALQAKVKKDSEWTGIVLILLCVFCLLLYHLYSIIQSCLFEEDVRKVTSKWLYELKKASSKCKDNAPSVLPCLVPCEPDWGFLGSLRLG